MRRFRVFLLGPLLATGCGSELPVPDKPTWAADVQPILQANCFHCHGAEAKPAMGQIRWDVYDLTEMPYADMGFVPDTKVFTSPFDQADRMQMGHFQFIKAYISVTDASRMPPPPATALSARDIEVLKKWEETGFEKGEHSPNHKPRIAWLSKPVYQVVDDDGDQVLGMLDCGGMMLPIPRSGGHTLPEEAVPPCTATLYDGFEQVTGTLR